MVKYYSSLLMLIIFHGCAQVYDWQTKYPDNFAEEAIENLIKNKTGKEVDLTPITGEERQTFDQEKKDSE